MTGNARSLSVSRWVPARSNSSIAWLMYDFGYFNNRNAFFYNYYRCEAVALLTFGGTI
jgi:glutaminase